MSHYQKAEELQKDMLRQKCILAWTHTVSELSKKDLTNQRLKQKGKNGLKCGVRFLWNDKRQKVNLTLALEQISTQETDFI